LQAINYYQDIHLNTEDNTFYHSQSAMQSTEIYNIKNNFALCSYLKVDIKCDIIWKPMK